jgi:hypothetical protein
VETATQTLHRLTSYTPGRAWDQPADDPRVVQDLQTNDMDRFPWFLKRYAQELPRVPLPAGLPPTTAAAAGWLAGTPRRGLSLVFPGSSYPQIPGGPAKTDRRGPSRLTSHGRAGPGTARRSRKAASPAAWRH